MGRNGDGRSGVLEPRVLLLAMSLGVVTGVGVWLFKRAIDAAEWLSHGWFAEHWTGVGVPAVVLIPIAGGLVVGLILHLARVPEEPGHGVEEVIESVALGSREFPERPTLIKVPVAALSLGSGASLGPEDPAVEIGGGIAAFTSHRLGLTHDQLQALVAACAAGGLAAAFHAPLAAVAFAREVFALRLFSRTILLVAVAVAASYLAMRLLQPESDLAVPGYTVESVWEVALCIGLGVATGVMSALHIRLMYSIEHGFIRWKTPPRWCKPVIGGALLGLAGMALPELLGVGYETLERILEGEFAVWPVLLVLALGKMLLMAVSFGSGFLGGFFAPCLFIGAATGAAWGIGAADLLPAADVRPAVFALAGMAALLAGCVRAPFAAVLLIAALSGSYSLLPLLLAAALPAYWVSKALEAHSLYTYGIEHPLARNPPEHPGGPPETDAKGDVHAAE